MASSIWGEEPDWFQELDDLEQGITRDKGSDEGDEEDLAGNDLPGAQHLLMLVDAGAKGIWDPTLPDPEYEEDKISPIDLLWQAVERMIRSKIRTSVTLHTGKRDCLGILLYRTKYRTPVAAKKDDINTEKEAEEMKEKESNEEEDDDVDHIMGNAAYVASTVHEFLPLEPPGTSTVQMIRQVQDDIVQGRRRDLHAEYASSDTDSEEEQQQNHLHLALQHALQTFRNSKYVRKPKDGEAHDLKEIWIFTTDDNPTQSNPDILQVLETSFRDTQENGIKVSVWPLPRLKGKEPALLFDYSLFYDALEAMAPLRDENLQGDADSIRYDELLLKNMLLGWKKIRRALTLPLLLPNWKEQQRPGLAMDIYRLVQEAKVPNLVPIHQRTGRVLSRITQVVGGGGELLDEKRRNALSSNSIATVTVPSDRFRHFCRFGGEKIPINLQDKEALKKGANANQEFASLILIGFRPKDSIPIPHVLRGCYFAYPAEERAAGSITAFAHLHASMLRKGVLAVGELLARVTSTSRLVAMWPQEEEAEEMDCGDHILLNQKRPPGMMILSLPFEDEVRHLGTDAAVQALHDGEGTVIASEEAIAVAIKLIEKQTLADVEIGKDFENARLVKFWDYVEHKALEQPLSATKEFDTVLDEDAVTELVGKEIVELATALPEDIKPEPKKRKLEPDDSGVDWEKFYREGRLADCKVPELKKKLRSLGEKIGGNKQNLIDRLESLLTAEFDGNHNAKKEMIDV